MKGIYYIKLFAILLFGIYGNVSFSQNVGINTKTPDKSALLDIEGKNMGVMFPKIYLKNTTDQTTIPTPRESLIIFNTNKSLFGNVGLVYWNGVKWVKFFTNIRTGVENEISPISITTQNSYTINNEPTLTPYTFGDKISSDWTILNDFTREISLNTSSDLLINLSGMYHLNNTEDGFISLNIAIFIDNKLSNIKTLTNYLTGNYSFRNFNQNFLLPNISSGIHEIKVAICNRKLNFKNSKPKPIFGGQNSQNNLSIDETKMNLSIFTSPNN